MGKLLTNKQESLIFNKHGRGKAVACKKIIWKNSQNWKFTLVSYSKKNLSQSQLLETFMNLCYIVNRQDAAGCFYAVCGPNVTKPK